MNYSRIIEVKYPGAKAFVDFEVTDWSGFEGRGVEITMWNLPDPPPTLEELEAYAATLEYHTARAAHLKAEAEAEINRWANEKVMQLKILEPELFYVAMVSNVAFRLLEWHSLGRPEAVDPVRFIVTQAEAQAYREAHIGQGNAEETMTSADLLKIQETRWNAMQQGFAAIVYQRRLALEKIKLAQLGEGLEAELAAVLAGMEGS